MSNVTHLRPTPTKAEKRAELWEGIVRFMVANEKKEIGVGLDEAKQIAAVMRQVADRE